MKKFLLEVTVLVLLVAGVPAQANDGVTPLLKMDTTYQWALGQDQIRPPFWFLVWEGTIQGDVNGVIRWWVDFGPMASPSGFVGRWEFLDCPPVYPITCPLDEPALLMMAGYDAGAYVSATEWSGKGIVTFVGAGYPQYAKWFGRRITDGGWVDFIDVGGVLTPEYGEGPFVIYDRPSNKH